MNSFRSIKPSTWLFYIGLVAACTSPVWGVAYFVNQDGSGHVQSAFLIGEILRGHPLITGIYALNSICVPNFSVHLILAVLLNLFSAFTTTKIVVCALFAGLVASVGWLRFATVGTEGLKTSLLIGAVIGFNWLWLVGSYNFIFSVIILTITLGIYWNWRERLNLVRAVALALLFAAAYFSHIIGFAILAGGALILAVNLRSELRYRAVAWTSACLVPFVPLAIWYRSISDDGSPALPVWRSLSDPYSLASWVTQFRSADAFLLISRTAFPFVEFRHIWFVIFSATFWMAAAFGILLFVTIRQVTVSKYLTSSYFSFAALFFISAVMVMIAPDDFGLSRGGIIRERIFICGLVFLVPLFRIGSSKTLERVAQTILLLVILFQSAAVWDYAIRADRSARAYIAAKSSVNEVSSIATITVYTEHPRFHSWPEPQLNLYNSIGNDVIAWDNYEQGHFLFPVRAGNKADKDFIFQLTTSNVFFDDDPEPVFAERLGRLDAALGADGGRIDAMLVLGGRPDVDAVVGRYFESEPIYRGENLRMFRRRK